MNGQPPLLNPLITPAVAPIHSVVDVPYLEIHTSKIEQQLLLETHASRKAGSSTASRNKKTSHLPLKSTQVSVPGISSLPKSLNLGIKLPSVPTALVDKGLIVKQPSTPVKRKRSGSNEKSPSSHKSPVSPRHGRTSSPTTKRPKYATEESFNQFSDMVLFLMTAMNARLDSAHIPKFNPSPE